MKGLLARLRALWADEPVLVGTLLPLAATVGLITQAQASATEQAVSAVAAAAVQVAVAFGIRSRVSPAGKKN